MGRRAKLVSLTVVTLVLLAGHALAQQAELPTPSGFVNDYAGVVDEQTEARLETMARNFRQATDVDVAVVTLQSLGGRPLEEVALQLGRQWGIGAGEEKEGVLILLAVEDRRSRIEVSRHLEDELPDLAVFQILRGSREPFRRGEYGQGLATALESTLATIAEQRGINIEGIDQRRAFREERRRAPEGSFPLGTVFFIIMLVILLGLFRGGGGGGGRRRRSGYLPVPIIIPGGWGGSHGGGGWSGGGGSWGGFGGGGDFGGGGASDSW